MRQRILQILMIAFLLGARPADAMTARQCDAISNLVEHAMDLRDSGIPMQRALDLYEMETRPLAVWQNIVVTAYSVDAQFLSGSMRADLLTQVYAQCLVLEEPS